MRNGLLILLLFLFSCGEKKSVAPQPADLIPRDLMIDVMVDVHLLEAGMQVTAMPGPEHKEFGNYDIFKIHGVTHQQYERSISWYSSQLDEFDKMYDEVIARISRKQALEMGGKPVNKKPDSTSKTPQTPSGFKPMPGMRQKPGGN